MKFKVRSQTPGGGGSMKVTRGVSQSVSHGVSERATVFPVKILNVLIALSNQSRVADSYSEIITKNTGA